jgi:hypothetical protein
MNDMGMEQHLTLPNSLYVPQCTSRLICPRQIGIMTGKPSNRFTSTAECAHLTVKGHRTTIKYDSISHLPILYTAPGVSSFQRFCATQSYLTKTSIPQSYGDTQGVLRYMHSNLSKAQQHKLHMHEWCAHIH